MRIGKLRHRVAIQQLTLTQDPVTGEALEGWVDWAIVWASFEFLSVKEFISANSERSEVSARVMMRHRPGLDATMRLVHAGKKYDIAGILPDADSGKHYVTLAVSTGAEYTGEDVIDG